MQTGDIIRFGDHDWRVLDVQDDRALILTEEIIEKRPYHDVYQDTTWADCGLRKYLNGAFYDQFSEADQARIVHVTNRNADNPWYGTDGGVDTQDRIFLLDIEDIVCRYFGDSGHLLRDRTPKQRYWFGFKDENNEKRVATYRGHAYWWWVRSPGRINRTAVYVHGNPRGRVGINGNSVFYRDFGPERDGGVRPALWLKI